MEYKIKIDPYEKIIFSKLHKQLNGLQKLGNANHYGAECLLLKFCYTEKWLYYTYTNGNTGKTISEGTWAVSPEKNLVWLYYLLKCELKYTYLDTIFPQTVFEDFFNSPVVADVQKKNDKKYIKNCAQWLSYCLNIGWDKSDLDELEKLYWQQGKIITFSQFQQEVKPSEGVSAEQFLEAEINSIAQSWPYRDYESHKAAKPQELKIMIGWLEKFASLSTPSKEPSISDATRFVEFVRDNFKWSDINQCWKAKDPQCHKKHNEFGFTTERLLEKFRNNEK